MVKNRRRGALSQKAYILLLRGICLLLLALLSVGCPKPKPPPTKTPPPPPSYDTEAGAKLYKKNCAACHGKDGKGSKGVATPSLNNRDALAAASDDYYRFIIQNGRSGTAMTPFKDRLSKAEIDNIVAFIRTWQPAGADPGEVTRMHGVVERGAAYYRGNCATCHGSNGVGGLGNRLNSRSFLSIVSDEFLAENIIHGRPGTAMASWKHLPPQAVADLIAYIRQWQPKAPVFNDVKKHITEGNREIGAKLFAGRCSTCHGAAGEGGIGPTLGGLSDSESTYRAIVEGDPDKGSPSWSDLSAEQVGALMAHLGTLKKGTAHSTEAGKPELGAEIYKGNCASCHGNHGEGASGPQLNNPTFLRTASDGFLTGTIVLGRTETAMRSMVHGQSGVGQIAPEDVKHLVAHMRTWLHDSTWRVPRQVVETSESSVALGKENFENFCSGCHGTNGKGVQDGKGFYAPALNNPEFLQAASDGFLQATIARGRAETPMRPFGDASSGIAALDGESINQIVAYIRTWQKRSDNKEESK